jgi:hypothetical protein
VFVSYDDEVEENSKLPDTGLNGEKEEEKSDEEESGNSNESSENEGQTEERKLEFPDTEIKIEHVRGNQ